MYKKAIFFPGTKDSVNLEEATTHTRARTCVKKSFCVGEMGFDLLFLNTKAINYGAAAAAATTD